MRKVVILIGIICILALTNGCAYNNKADIKETTSEIKETEKTEDVVADYGYAIVYDVTKYNTGVEGFIPQYQYFVFNKDKTEVIDTGMMSYYDPQFSEISPGIVKAEYGTGATDEWVSVYYNLSTQSKSEKYKYAILEFGEKVVFLHYENKRTYLKVKDMFGNNEEKFLIGDELYNPALVKAIKNNNVIEIKYINENGEEYMKNINL